MNQEDPLAGFPTPPSWALDTGHAGRLLIYAALALFLIAAVLGPLAGRVKAFKPLSGWAFGLGTLGVFGALGCLLRLFVGNQFEYDYVFKHGDIHTPLQYKISGVWSGQQGSFLLWACTSALFGLLALRGTDKYRGWWLATYSVFLATLCGILSYETPFGFIPELVKANRIVVPPTGQGLAPSLLNYWMVIHPPTIFLGFGSLTVMFAYAVSAMLTGDVGGWAKLARPWSLVSLAILGLGICMGGFWAYETLNWGGFWGWDPVENASFIPWLCVAALVHGLIVQVSRKRWHGANLWLGAMPFLAFAYGTFLTRGGFLENVSNHSFASMEKSALRILEIFLGLVWIGFPVLFLLRGRKLAAAANAPAPESAGELQREGLYKGGVLFLNLLGAVLALGMSWPVLMALSGRNAAKVEEALYHKVVVWFFVPIFVLCAIGPFVSWRGMGYRELWKRISTVVSISVALTGAGLLALKFTDWGTAGAAGSSVSMPFGFRAATLPWVAFLTLLCSFVLVANLWRAGESFRRSRESVGAFVSHAGLAVLFGGLILSRGLEQKERLFVASNSPETALGYTLKFAGMEGQSLQDRDNKVKFEVTDPKGKQFTMRPGLYFQPSMDGGEDKPFVWPAIEHYAGHDVYLSLGAPIYTAWEAPVSFLPGETKTISDITVKYQDLVMEGTPGTPSASFGAKLQVTILNKDKVPRMYEATPRFTVADGPSLARVNSQFLVSMLSMNAADRSANIQVFLANPVYPVELFTKPLTGFVWTGTGIMFIGGLISAYSRRRRKARQSAEEPAEKRLETLKPLEA